MKSPWGWSAFAKSARVSAERGGVIKVTSALTDGDPLVRGLHWFTGKKNGVFWGPHLCVNKEDREKKGNEGRQPFSKKEHMSLMEERFST